LRKRINLSEKCDAIIFRLKVKTEEDCSSEKFVKCYKATYCQVGIWNEEIIFANEVYSRLQGRYYRNIQKINL